MNSASKTVAISVGALMGASASCANTLATHRIPAALALEAASETVAACAKQGYHETAVVLEDTRHPNNPTCKQIATDAVDAVGPGHDMSHTADPDPCSGTRYERFAKYPSGDHAF